MSTMQTEIKKALEEHFLEGARIGFKEGFERGKKGFVSSNPEVYGEFHHVYKHILNFAVKVNITSSNKFNPPSKFANVAILSRSCSYKIGEHACILYQSIFSLCESGWASITPILRRSLVECLLNEYLILKEHNDYWAFRFYSHGFLNSLISEKDEPEVKEEARRELDKLFQQLSSSDAKRAKDYESAFLIKRKYNDYWYRPDFQSARAILPASIYAVYQIDSSSVHSSLIGMDLSKDRPLEIGINPRDDAKSIKMALVGAFRVLYEIVNIRVQYENLDLKKESKDALQLIINLEKCLEAKDSKV